ncbi:hypothetical protein RI054_31g122600 [Pseudoscourfieldia marina]
MIFVEGSEEPTWRFQCWYDATAQRDVYEHGVGNKDEICVISKVGPEGAPCGVMNDAVAGKVLVWPRDPNTGAVTGCCEFVMGGKRTDTYFTRPDWLQESQAKYTGQHVVHGVEADVWFVQASYDNHYAVRTDQPGQVPLSFWEHMGGSTPYKEWYFENFVVHEQKIEPPAQCVNVPLCPGQPNFKVKTHSYVTFGV